MNAHSLELLNAALALSNADRADLAASLLRSLDPSDDPEADEAWAAEIGRRIKSVDNGDVRLLPWDDVMSEMRERRNG